MKFGTRVAVKLIKQQFAQQSEARARFEIEARAAARLQTKHAVRVHDYGVSDDGLPYIVMEFLEGESLSEAIIARGSLPPTEVAILIAQASRALARAHAVGIVHRDLKPDNIFSRQAMSGSMGFPMLSSSSTLESPRFWTTLPVGPARPGWGALPLRVR